MIELMVLLQFEIETESNSFRAIEKAIINTAKAFNSTSELTARTVVIFFLEATTLIPGVFNVDMLRERQILQDYLHGPQHFQSFRKQTLEYKIDLTSDLYRTPAVRRTSNLLSKSTQTELENPAQGEMLNFAQRKFSLEWVLHA